MVRDGGGDSEHSTIETMFERSKEILRGPFKIQTGIHEYPFELYFPEKFEFNKSNVWPENNDFDAQRGLLPLPPSSPWLDFTGSHLFRVYYHLKVKIPRDFGDCEEKIVLQFAPFRTDFNPSPNPLMSRDTTIFYRNYKLSSEGLPQALTKMDHLKGTFRTKNSQTFGFSLSATAPTAIILGRPYDVEVTVIPTAAVWENSPEIRLKYHTLHARAEASVRVPVRYSGGNWDSKGTQNFDTVLSAGALDAVVVPNKSMRLTGMFNRKGNPPIMPAFTSFGVKLKYSLKLKITVSCLGVESTFKIKWPEIKVYPEKMEPGLEEALRTIEGGNVMEGELGLPSYFGGEGGELPGYQR